MRLINVKTLKLEEFLDHPPAYAILSHTWGDDAEELTFRDVQDGNIDKPGIGAIKLRGCCRQAEKDKLGYAWIDTCCINKSDLAELTEAINSMFRWYGDASVCYAYLADVPADDNSAKEGSKFHTSRWFRRGWTLQELLAPETVRFYNADWNNIGTKGSMCAAIGKITGVPRQFLLGITDLHTASVAQRMSWAAQRETKKKEDLAYCLLGLFNVTMPLIYGEGGDQAFFRLQEQIMKTMRDDSVLAWGFSDTKSAKRDSQIVAGKILAASPADYANSGHIVPQKQVSSSFKSFTVSGGSLRLNLALHTDSDGNTFGLLNCQPQDDDEHIIGIPLVKLPAPSDEYVRPQGDFAVLQAMGTSSNAFPMPVHIKHASDKKLSQIFMEIKKRYWLYEDDQLSEVQLSLIDVQPKSSWDEERALIISTIQPHNSQFDRSLARFRHKGEDITSQDFIVLLELVLDQDSGVKAECCAMVCSRSTASEQIFEKFDYLRQRASGTRSASNGLLNLVVELEPVAQQPIFIIKPKKIPNPPEITVDAAAELEKFELVSEFSSILEGKAQNDSREKWLEQAAKEKEEPLAKKMKQRQALEEEIKKLEVKRKLLLAEEINLRAEMYQVSDEQEEIRGKQQDAKERWLHAKERWAGLYGGIGSGTNTGSAASYELETMAGRTPLLWAAENGDVETVRLLLYQGADVTAVDPDGQTALSAASSNGHLEIVRLLLATGKIDVNAKDDAGQTALGWAAETGSAGLVQLLLENGKADVDAKDIQGWTALKWALEKKHDDVVSLLLKHGATAPETQLIQSQSQSQRQSQMESQSPPRETSSKTADYSKAIDSRILDMLARTSSMGALRGKAIRTSSDDKKPRSRTWFNLEGKRSHPSNVVIAETVEEVPCTERRRTS